VGFFFSIYVRMVSGHSSVPQLPFTKPPVASVIALIGLKWKRIKKWERYIYSQPAHQKQEFLQMLDNSWFVCFYLLLNFVAFLLLSWIITMNM